MSTSLVVVANDLNYPSGAQQYTLQLISALAKEGMNVAIWTGTPADGDTCRAASVASVWNVHPRYFRRGRTWFERYQRIREERAFFRWVRENGPTYCLVMMDWPRRLYGALCRHTRALYFAHSTELTCAQDERARYLAASGRICDVRAGLACLRADGRDLCLGRRPIWRKWQRVWQTRSALRALNGIPDVVAVSSYVVKIVQMHCPRPRLHILEPPIAVDGFPQFIDPQSRDPSKRFRLLYAARVLAVKGIFEALAVLRDLPAHYRLIVAGAGSDVDVAKQRAAILGVAERVEFLGWLGREALTRMLPQCGAVLMPGLWAEAFGMIGPEALSAGVPVVAYATGGIPSWAATNAVRCVPVGDREAFGRALRDLTEDLSGWHEVCEMARSYAGARFAPGLWTRALLSMLCDDASFGRLTKC